MPEYLSARLGISVRRYAWLGPPAVRAGLPESPGSYRIRAWIVCLGVLSCRFFPGVARGAESGRAIIAAGKRAPELV